MHALKASLSLLLASALLATGCIAGDVEETAKSRQALSSPSRSPVPIGWDGTTVELMIADAIGECEWTGEASSPVHAPMPVTMVDDYLRWIGMRMTTAGFCGYSNWYDRRVDSSCNVDAVTGVTRAANLRRSLLLGRIDSPYPIAAFSAAAPYAQAQLQLASMNLCIAQHLRDLSPGTAGGEALLLSGAEQRELLEAIRGRSQAAMLQYAALAVALATPPITGTPTLNPHQTIPVLHDWSRTVVGDHELSLMGNDFAATVQLHVTAQQRRRIEKSGAKCA